MPTTKTIKKSPLSPTAIIFGGAGFIGSHLAEEFLSKDVRTVVVDNFSSGKEIYVQALLQNDKFALFDADINKGIPEQLESADYVIHLAGLEQYLFDKSNLNLDSLLTNSIGTKNILEFCAKSEGKLVVVSSIDVYSGLISPTDIASYFGKKEIEEKEFSSTEAKRYAEALVWEFYKKTNLDVRIVRLPEVYGPRMNLYSSGQLGHQLDNLLNNQNIEVFGEGEQKEYYLYVKDAVSGIIKSLFTDNTQGKIFNLINSSSKSALEIAYILKDMANSEVVVAFKPNPSPLVIRDKYLPENAYLKDLNWSEKTNLNQGLAKTLSWFNYEVNEHAFKPAKLIEQKTQAKSGLFSLVSKASFGIEEQNNTSALVSNAQSMDVTPKASADANQVPIISIADTAKVTNQDSSPFEETSLTGFSNKSRISALVTKVRLKALLGPLSRLRSKKASAASIKPPKPSVFVRFKGVFLLVSLFLFVVLITAGVPSIMLYYHSQAGVSAALKTQENIQNLNQQEALVSSEKAFNNFVLAQKDLNRLRFYAVITGNKTRFSETQRAFQAATYASRAGYFVSRSLGPFTSLWESLNPNSTQIVDESSFTYSKAELLSAYDNLLLAQAEVSSLTFSDSNNPHIRELKSNVSSAISEIELMLSIIDNIPDLLGLEGEKEYLILFQNSNEIRPTGGFIGSYATLKLEDGKIVDLVIDDIYNPDGQIELREIEVTPPEPIATYLNEERLFIRNANWDPDFTKSSDQITDLFFKLDAREYHGVVALDLNVLDAILKVTGPVYLAAYNEEITAENVYERTQFHSEFNYQDGSEQKKTFLTLLGGKLLERVFALEQENLTPLMLAFRQALDERHMLVDIPNSNINTVLTNNNWNGAFVDTPKDYLQVVNANLGGTKANYYVDENMNYEVFSATRDGVLRSKLNLEYKHNGEDSSWPGGPYTNYVRVFVPQGSSLTGAKIMLDAKGQDIFDSIVVYDESKHTVFAYGFTVQPQEQATLTFEYDLPESLSVEGLGDSYSLYWQKQAGTTNDQVEVLFNAPFGMVLETDIEGVELGENSASLSKSLDRDLQFEVTLN